MEVAQLDDVRVDDADRPHSGRREVEQRRRPEPARADDEHARRGEPLLSLETHSGHEDVPRVAGELRTGQLPPGPDEGFGSHDVTVLPRDAR